VVDDEANIRHIIAQYLVREGLQVETFSSVEEVLTRLQSGYPDLFILDIMLPGKDGLEFCQEIRRLRSTPVIFISARGEEADRVLGLELGGDDYLSKPFSPRELVARVRSLFRRVFEPQYLAEIFEMGNLRIYSMERRVTVGEKELLLTAKEYDLLLLLVQNPRRTFNRQELLDRVWGYEYVGGPRSVDDLVKRLRRKLREPGCRINISTIWGYGYKLSD